MNSLNQWNPLIGVARVALIAVILTPSALFAENGFNVTPGTGLETETSLPSKKSEKPAAPAVAERKATEITCTGETTFDAKAGMAMFVKEVKVNDAQFTLSADKLTAYLKKAVKEPEKKEEAESNQKETPADIATPASGLERAVAEGNVIISQDKVDEKTGEVTHYIGKGAKADYSAVTGELTLSGWPQIQQGLSNLVATEEGTVMIMNKEGHLRTKGAAKTVIKADAKPAKVEKPDKTETAKPDLLKVP